MYQYQGNVLTVGTYATLRSADAVGSAAQGPSVPQRQKSGEGIVAAAHLQLVSITTVVVMMNLHK